MNKVIKISSNLILLWLLLIPTLAHSQGSRYTGSYKKSSPIEHVGKKNITIEGLEFTSSYSRAAITLWGCENVIIRNCKFKDIKDKLAIYAEGGSNISVIDCTFENVYSGFRATTSSGSIRFDHNDVKNIIGNLYGGSARTQAVQFNRCNGAGSSISYNSIENIAGESSPEDIINLFNSHGTSQSPIIVKSNWIRGGGPSMSSGGITTGDFGGSYIIVEDNILVNSGQGGMGTAGGHDIIVRNNKIYSKKRPFTNVGLVIANFQPQVTGKSYNIIAENNEINWTHRDGYINNTFYDRYVEVRGLETNKYNPKLNESILPEIIINRAKNSNDKPEVEQPIPPTSKITSVYIDNFKRVAIKYLVPSIPNAYAEGYSSTGQLLITMALPRYNQAFPVSVPRGDYYIKIIYPNLGKEEITKITIN